MCCPFKDMLHVGNQLAGLSSIPPVALSVFSIAVPCCTARDEDGRTARVFSPDATLMILATLSMASLEMQLQMVLCLQNLWRSTSTACGGVYRT